MIIALRSPEAWAKRQAQLTCSAQSPESTFTTGIGWATNVPNVGPALEVIAVPYCERTTLNEPVSPQVHGARHG